MMSGLMSSGLAALAGALLWATPSAAGDAASAVPPQVRENAAAVAQMMDADGDGRISRAEFLRHNALASRFVALDANGDDALDANEQKAVTVGGRTRR